MKDHPDNSTLPLELHSADGDRSLPNGVDESFACVSEGLNVDPNHWQWTNLMMHLLDLKYAAVRVM